MKQYKLTIEEIIKVSHLSAERATVSVTVPDSKRFVENYMKTYNSTRNELEAYNHSVSGTE